MDVPLISFRNAALGYGRKTVLRDVSFDVLRGEYFGIVGPNGAGKTTLVRAILGMVRPQGGTVALLAPNIRFGYVPQRDAIDNVLPFRAGEVVLMGRYRQIGRFRRAGPADVAAARASLRHVGAEELFALPFRDLSGGQKQRVLIARALASSPTVLILDEPTNGMDFASRLAILELTAALHRDDRLTVILVSHLLDDVANNATRIALVESSFFRVGPVHDILNGETLSRLYGRTISVASLNGRTVVLAGGSHDPR
jgi:ABC-type Mn2+/Zn2+ transport system ATPase subunit